MKKLFILFYLIFTIPIFSMEEENGIIPSPRQCFSSFSEFCQEFSSIATQHIIDNNASLISKSTKIQTQENLVKIAKLKAIFDRQSTQESPDPAAYVQGISVVYGIFCGMGITIRSLHAQRAISQDVFTRVCTIIGEASLIILPINSSATLERYKQYLSETSQQASTENKKHKCIIS